MQTNLIGKHTSNVTSQSLTYKAYPNQDDYNLQHPFKALKANLGSFKFGPHSLSLLCMVTILYKYKTFYCCIIRIIMSPQWSNLDRIWQEIRSL